MRTLGAGVAFIDSIFVCGRLSSIMLHHLNEHSGAIIQRRHPDALAPCYAIHQPDSFAMTRIDRHVRDGRCRLTGIHTALDIPAEGVEHASQMQDAVTIHLDHPFSRASAVMEVTTRYTRPRKSAINFVLYSDRKSKVTGDACLHVELRLHGKRTLRSAGIRTLSAVDPDALVRSRLRFSTFMCPDDIRTIGLMKHAFADEYGYSVQSARIALRKMGLNPPRFIQEIDLHDYPAKCAHPFRAISTGLNSAFLESVLYRFAPALHNYSPSAFNPISNTPTSKQNAISAGRCRPNNPSRNKSPVRIPLVPSTNSLLGARHL